MQGAAESPHYSEPHSTVSGSSSQSPSIRSSHPTSFQLNANRAAHGQRPRIMPSYASPPTLYQLATRRSSSPLNPPLSDNHSKNPSNSASSSSSSSSLNSLSCALSFTPDTALEAIRDDVFVNSDEGKVEESAIDARHMRSQTLASPQPLLASLYNQYTHALQKAAINLEGLAQLCWKGIPAELRAPCWQYLFDYLPSQPHKHPSFLEKRLQEYKNLFTVFLPADQASSSSPDKNQLTTSASLPAPFFDPALYHQIQIDLPRTLPDIPFFKSALISRAMRRILYFWSIRHPACGYVQGLNDLLAPILAVFFSHAIFQKYYWKGCENSRWSFYYDQVLDLVLTLNQGSADICLAAALNTPSATNNAYWYFTEDEFLAVETDSYFCFTKLLEPLQNRYTVGQPSIFKEIHYIVTLLQKIDPPLMVHFQREKFDVAIILFRWLNCLCLRELPFKCIIRLWDTCLSELHPASSSTDRRLSVAPRFDGFQVFYTFFMVAFLRSWSKYLQTLDFQVSLYLFSICSTSNNLLS
jgi:TBC1 domain family member 2